MVLGSTDSDLGVVGVGPLQVPAECVICSALLGLDYSHPSFFFFFLHNRQAIIHTQTRKISPIIFSLLPCEIDGADDVHQKLKPLRPCTRSRGRGVAVAC
jgi:hypothetical protein